MSLKSTPPRTRLHLNWPSLAVLGGLFAGLGALLYFRLGSLLPGFTPAEAQAYNDSQQLSTLLDNPMNAPFYLVVRGLDLISDHGLILTRIAATLFGIATLVLFCWLLGRWFGLRTAVLGTLMLGTSAWFLHTARAGTPDVLMFSLIALVAAGVWLKRTNNPFVLLLCFLLAAASVYVPGMIWLIVLVGLWEWKQIDFIFKRHLWAVSLGTLVFMAALTPLVWAFYQTPALFKSWAGLPLQGWPDILGVLQNILEVPLALFVRAPSNPEVWLGNLPILDAFASAMLLLGAWLYLKYVRLARAKLFIPVMAIGWVLVALGGAVSISILVPFVYIIVAVGIGFMIDLWLNVFPRNPLAKIVGFVLVSAAILVSVNFQLREYFIAWPNTPQTREVFSVQPLPR